MRFFYLVFFFCLIAISCKKEQECDNYKEFSEIQIDNSMNAFKFREGTYWVYRNDATSELDSQRVIFDDDNSFTAEYPSVCSEGTYMHEYRMSVHSFLSNNDYDYFLRGSYFCKDTSAMGSHYGRYIYNGLDEYSDNIGAELIENIPTINLNGTTYFNVRKIWIKVADANSHFPNLSQNDMYFYFSNSIGLLKWEVFDGSTIIESWSLKSCDIIL